MSEQKKIVMNPEKLQELQRIYLKALEDRPELWRKPMEDQFQERSQGRIRAFHTLHMTIEGLVNEKSKYYAIGEEELEQLYSSEKEKILALGPSSYCYLFTVGNGTGFLIAASYLHY
jgi:hypothetical protein